MSCVTARRLRLRRAGGVASARTGTRGKRTRLAQPPRQASRQKLVYRPISSSTCPAPREGTEVQNVARRRGAVACLPRPFSDDLVVSWRIRHPQRRRTQDIPRDQALPEALRRTPSLPRPRSQRTKPARRAPPTRTHPRHLLLTKPPDDRASGQVRVLPRPAPGPVCDCSAMSRPPRSCPYTATSSAFSGARPRGRRARRGQARRPRRRRPRGRRGRARARASAGPRDPRRRMAGTS